MRLRLRAVRRAPEGRTCGRDKVESLFVAGIEWHFWPFSGININSFKKKALKEPLNFLKSRRKNAPDH
jgi:hypothetical protein